MSANKAFRRLRKKRKWTMKELAAQGWVEHKGRMLNLNGGQFMIGMPIGPDGLCREEEKVDVDPYSMETEELDKLLKQFALNFITRKGA